MTYRSRLIPAVTLAVLVWLLAITPALAHAEVVPLELRVPTADYVIGMRMGPPGLVIPLVPEQLDVPQDDANLVAICTTDPALVGPDAFERGTFHLAIQVFDRPSGKLLEVAVVSIEIENALTAQRQTIRSTPMVDMSEGGGLHYGGNVFAPDGRYRVSVVANGQPAEFDFVIRSGNPEPVPDLPTVLWKRGLAPMFYLALGLAAFVVAGLVVWGRINVSAGRGATLLFLDLLVFQGVHQFEHIVQVIQAFVFHIPNAAGLVGGFFGLEAVHFAYNAWFFALGVAVFMTFGVRQRDQMMRATVAAIFLGLGVAIQSYHMFEYLVKVAQFLESGLNGVPGLLGRQVNPIWLHFWLNTIAYTPFFVSAVVSGTYREIGDLIRSSVATLPRLRPKPR